MTQNWRQKRILVLCTFYICIVLLPFNSLAAQQLGQGTDAADLTVWRLLGALLFIALLIAGAWAVIRNRGGTLPFFQKVTPRRIKLLEIQRISPQSQIFLIEFENTEYLVALTSHSVNVIETRPIAVTENSQ
jgi:flagellar biogenesis protein FliO